MGNGKFYTCPYCPQTSTRQWNMKRHMQRCRMGSQGPASNTNNEPFESSRPVIGANPYSTSRNVSAHPKNDQMSDYWQKALEPWQEALKPLQKFRDLLESWSKLKAQFSASTDSLSQQSASFPFSFPFTYLCNSNNQQPSVPPKSFSQPSIQPSTIKQQPPLNPNPPSSFSEPTIGAPSAGGILGYKGFVCNKCLYADIFSFPFSSSFKGSLSVNHRCSQASMQGTLPSHYRSATLQERERELIFHLKLIIDKTTREYELIKLIAVRNPFHQFRHGSNSQEEYLNLDPMHRPVPSYIERAAIQGATVVYKNEILGFLEIFLGTLGYFRFRVCRLPHYFFIYISNWLEPEI